MAGKITVWLLTLGAFAMVNSVQANAVSFDLSLESDATHFDSSPTGSTEATVANTPLEVDSSPHPRSA